jgi:hypothetical protein
VLFSIHLLVFSMHKPVKTLGKMVGLSELNQAIAVGHGAANRQPIGRREIFGGLHLIG